MKSSFSKLQVFYLNLLFLFFIIQKLPKVQSTSAEIPPPAAAVFMYEAEINSNNSVQDLNKKNVKEGSEQGPDTSYPAPHKMLLNDIVNTEVDVVQGRKVEMECMASNPVQWSYRGPGRPQFYTNVTVDVLNNREVYKASLTILIAHEKDTGLYVCSYTEFPRIASTYHIFVPGPDVFVSDSGRSITYSSDTPVVTIPCPVSVKRAKVTLRKVHFDKSLRNVESPIATFDPKLGFQLSVKDLRDADGTYICSGYHQGTLRIREYTIRNEERNQTSVTFPESLQEDINPCLSYRCPSRSICRVNLNTNQPFCACGPKASVSTSNCTRLCKTTRDCPKTEKCQFRVEKQLKMCVHVCEDHQCAENGECYVDEQRGGAPKCRCRRGFQGDGDNNCERIPLITEEILENSYCSAAKCGPHARCQNVGGKVRCTCYVGYSGSWPYCQKACTQDSDCDILERCSSSKAVCERVCSENICAPKAECKVLHRKPMCICPPGYTGKATEACYPSHYYYSSRSGLPAETDQSDFKEDFETTTIGRFSFDEIEDRDYENGSLKLTLPVSAEESNTQSSSQ